MLAMKAQRPQVHQRTDRKGTYWFFRYWQEEPLSDGSIRTIRRFHTLGASSGPNALTQLEAEAQRLRGDHEGTHSARSNGGPLNTMA